MRSHEQNHCEWKVNVHLKGKWIKLLIHVGWGCIFFFKGMKNECHCGCTVMTLLPIRKILTYSIVIKIKETLYLDQCYKKSYNIIWCPSFHRICFNPYSAQNSWVNTFSCDSFSHEAAKTTKRKVVDSSLGYIRVCFTSLWIY